MAIHESVLSMLESMGINPKNIEVEAGGFRLAADLLLRSQEIIEADYQPDKNGFITMEMEAMRYVRSHITGEYGCYKRDKGASFKSFCFNLCYVHTEAFTSISDNAQCGIPFFHVGIKDRPPEPIEYGSFTHSALASFQFLQSVGEFIFTSINQHGRNFFGKDLRFTETVAFRPTDAQLFWKIAGDAPDDPELRQAYIFAMQNRYGEGVVAQIQATTSPENEAPRCQKPQVKYSDLIERHRKRSKEFDALIRTLEEHESDYQNPAQVRALQKRVALTFTEHAELQDGHRRADEVARILKPDDLSV